MHKIAILSDIHGNIGALEAVLADAMKEQVTQYWVMGDLLSPGPGSSDLLMRVRALPNVVFVKGNWDDFFLTIADADLTHPTNVYGARLAMYHDERLSQEEMGFLESLPLSLVKKVGGLEFLLCHNMPDSTYGGQLWISAKQENFDALFTNHKVDVAVYGHVHHPMLRYSTDGQLIINPGSVCSSYFHWDKYNQSHVGQAQYAIINVCGQRMGDIQFKKVGYDIHQEIQLATKQKLPYLDLYVDTMRTGRNYTHDIETLERVSTERGYKDEVMAYFRSESK